MTDADWADPERRVLGVLLDGQAIAETDSRGRPIVGDTLFIVLNAGADEVTFVMPRRRGRRWERLIDTADPDGAIARVEAGAEWRVPGHSSAVFRHT